ncbi:hypothetical protein KA005_70650 [bacterium]|nr:hypothetical protein [bacterium]
MLRIIIMAFAFLFLFPSIPLCENTRKLVAQVSFSSGSTYKVDLFRFNSENTPFQGGFYQPGEWDSVKPLRIVVDDLLIYTVHVKKMKNLYMIKSEKSESCSSFDVNFSFANNISLKGKLYLEEQCTDDEFDNLWISFPHYVLGKKGLKKISLNDLYSIKCSEFGEECTMTNSKGKTMKVKDVDFGHFQTNFYHQVQKVSFFENFEIVVDDTVISIEFDKIEKIEFLPGNIKRVYTKDGLSSQFKFKIPTKFQYFSGKIVDSPASLYSKIYGANNIPIIESITFSTEDNSR